ncbi:MAG: hypothetical protein AB8B85_17735 [Paracoccaceae bacterium]
MSSNPLGDAFYDDDGVSITGAEPAVKQDPLSEGASQPYFTSSRPTEPIQLNARPESDAPVQRYEPDNRYVQPDRTPRPAQALPLPQQASSEPLAPASTATIVEPKSFKDASAKPAVVVTKTPPGQSKLAKARAAARRAASVASVTSAVTTAPEANPSSIATKVHGRGDQTTLEASMAPHDLGNQPAGGDMLSPMISEASTRKLKPRKPSTNPEVSLLGDSVVKATEQTDTNPQEGSSDEGPFVRRAKSKERISSADKMRAQRGIRASKVKR